MRMPPGALCEWGASMSSGTSSQPLSSPEDTRSRAGLWLLLGLEPLCDPSCDPGCARVKDGALSLWLEHKSPSPVVSGESSCAPMCPVCVCVCLLWVVRGWGQRFSSLFPEYKSWDNLKDPDRPITIGYVSPDYFTHSVSYFIEAPLTFHDHALYRIVVYSAVVKVSCCWGHPVVCFGPLVWVSHSLLGWPSPRAATVVMG